MRSFNYNNKYIVVIPKCYKNPKKNCCTVKIECNTYNNKASNSLLTILTPLYNITL